MPLGPRPADIPWLERAVRVYKVSSVITGTLLIVLGIVSCIRWFGDSDIYLGPRGLFLSTPHALGGGTNLTTIILVIHGWFYVLYVGLDFVMWRLARFSFGRFLFIALGGIIPLLSFFLERRVPRQIAEIIRRASAPQAAPTVETTA